LRDIIKQIGQKYDHVSISGSSFTDHGCTVKLDNLGDYIALKSEFLCKNPESMCDCIVFKANDGIIIGAIELKVETKARRAMNQLANGAKLSLGILQEICGSKPKRIIHIILLHNGGWHQSEIRKISKGIVIDGKRYNINMQRCGYSFHKAIANK
jgi:hypothetical protein